MNCNLSSCQKWFIGNAIRDILVEDLDVSEQVGEHIYPLVAPENTKGDFIVYLRQKYGRESVKQGIYEDKCEVAVIAISEDYDRACELASNIDAALSGRHKVSTECTVDIILADSIESFEDNKYIETLVYSIQ